MQKQIQDILYTQLFLKVKILQIRTVVHVPP